MANEIRMVADKLDWFGLIKAVKLFGQAYTSIVLVRYREGKEPLSAARLIMTTNSRPAAYIHQELKNFVIKHKQLETPELLLTAFMEKLKTS